MKFLVSYLTIVLGVFLPLAYCKSTNAVFLPLATPVPTTSPPPTNTYCPFASGKDLSKSWETKCGFGWLNEAGQISNLAQVSGESYKCCQDHCDSMEQCVGYTFVNSEKRCDLKSETDAHRLVQYKWELISGTFVGLPPPIDGSKGV